MIGFEICEPGSLDEAFGLLDRDDPAVRPIAGGTALMLMMKAGLFRPQRLVSLRRIAGLSGITAGPDGLQIGAMTPLAVLERSPTVAGALPAIPRAMRTLANPRVRNVATVGGNLAHADPHLDLPPLWIALDATATLARPGATRSVPVAGLFTGYYETILAHDELITGLTVPARPGWRAAYTKVTTRAAHDWPALGIAVALALESDVVRDLRLALGAATAIPTRLVQAEAALRGSTVTDAALARAGEAAVAETEIDGDDRGSAAYKRHLLRVHLGRAVRALAGEPTP